jgi:peptidoglycan/LPS O-acetylase OafA/YrhL
MGTTKYIFSILILFSHNPLFQNYFRQFSIVNYIHYATIVLLLFALLETGYIAGKQLSYNVYKSFRDFFISRAFRIFLPCWIMLACSFAFMPNSLLFETHHQTTNIYHLIHQLNLTDKIIYYVAHITLSMNIFLYMLYSPTKHSFHFSTLLFPDSITAIRLSIAPTLWTALPDILIMLFFSYFFFKKYYKILIICYFSLIILQIYIVYYILHHHLDEMLIIQNLPMTLIFMMTGFLFGYKKMIIAPKNKPFALFLALLFMATGSIIGAFTMLNDKNLFLYSSIITLLLYCLACDFLWYVFAYKKFDMILRDLSVYIYLWHYFIFSVFYYYFPIRIFSTSIMLILYLIVIGLFGFYFEKYNRRWVKMILAKLHA